MIRVQADDFNVGDELANLSGNNYKIGGVCSFLGLVREIHPDAEDQSMTLEHYPAMTEAKLKEIDAEAHKRWPLEASLIIHRYGKLHPGERIVMVATASRHRDAAFESARFLMDFLKSKAPFWKLEAADGEAAWVDAREVDEDAIKRWE